MAVNDQMRVFAATVLPSRVVYPVKRLSVFIAALLASATAVQAEPISVGVALVSSFLATTAFTVGGTAISIGTIIQGALLVGGIAAQALLAPRSGGPGQQAQTVNPGAAKSTFDEPEGFEIRAVGRVRVGGLKVFGNTVQSDRWRLIWHCRGPIDGIEEWYIGGRKVQVESDTGEVSDPPYGAPTGSFIYLASKMGADNETSWTQLQTAFPELWTANHRARGVAQTLINYISPGIGTDRFAAMYQNGAPELQVVIRGEKILDPRTGNTVWSDNGILVAMHVAIATGLFHLSDFDIAFINDEADRADEGVATLTSSEPRARAWGIWTGESNPVDIIQSVLDSVGAHMVRRPGGLWGIALTEDEPEAELTIPASSIVDLKLRSGPESVERPNICRVSYYSPEREYEVAEIDMTGIGWAEIGPEVGRVGEHKLELKLPFCPSASQAQRIARRTFAMRRADSGVLVTNLADLPAWTMRYVNLELVDLDKTVLVELGSPRIDDSGATVEWPFVVVPTLKEWLPSRDEAAAPVAAGFQGVVSPIETPATPTGACVTVRPDNAFYEVRALISIPVGATGMTGRYRFASGGSGTMTADTAGTTKLLRLAGNFVSERMFARTRGHNADNMVSLWSPESDNVLALNTTAPNAPSFAIEVEDISATENRITARAVTTGQVGAVGIKITGPDQYPSIGDVTTYAYGGPDLELTRVYVVPKNTGSTPANINFTARVIASGPTDGTAANATHSIPA